MPPIDTPNPDRIMAAASTLGDAAVRKANAIAAEMTAKAAYDEARAVRRIACEDHDEAMRRYMELVK